MPRSSRGCSFVRCEGKARALCRKDDDRVKEFAEKDGHPAETMRPSHAHPLRKLCSGRRRFITDWRFARRLARIRGDRSHWTVTGQRSVSFDWRGLGDRDPLRSHEKATMLGLCPVEL